MKLKIKDLTTDQINNICANTSHCRDCVFYVSKPIDCGLLSIGTLDKFWEQEIEYDFEESEY